MIKNVPKASSVANVWLESFVEKHGRAPRVLHIGNIANNAYLNAKILNAAGVDCDVICYDYYHIMACPEWEDADFKGDIKDQFFPDWSGIDLNGFRRPTWFAQGPLGLCIDYLITKRGGDKRQAREYWRQLSVANKTGKGSKDALPKSRNFLFKAARYLRFLAEDRLYASKSRSISDTEVFENPKFKDLESLENIYKDWAGRWQTIFKGSFPHRPDNVQLEDIIGYYDLLPKLRQLFSHYDLVQGYATDGIFPLLAGFPYVAYEHGTIRNIPFQESASGRLCAMTYRQANHVCITNADNVVAARKLGLGRFTFVPHPINEEPLIGSTDQRKSYAALHRELNSDFLVFHPARQHWDSQRHPDWEKGNDIFIKGFAKFVKEVNCRAVAIFVEWGNTVEKSKGLIRELGITENIVWIQPLNAMGMAKYILSTDLLADQFFLGAFGSTLPRALACGKPAMLRLKVDVHEWCFAEMPPVVNVSNPEEVFSGLVTVFKNKEWVKNTVARGLAWYRRYHSNQVILERLSKIYESILSNPFHTPGK
ncbi:MAG: glycosyltransferase [Planctomycetota bacterium]